MLNTWRTPTVLWLRLLMCVAISIMVGTVWLGVGDDMEARDLQNVSGVLCFIVGFMAAMSIVVLPSLLIDRRVFLKEGMNNSYGVFSHNFSSVLASIPLSTLMAGICSLICYPCLQLDADGIKGVVFFLNLVVTLVCAESIVYCVSTLTPHLVANIATTAIIFGCYMMVDGFFIRVEDIPAGWRWLHHVGFHSYSFRNFMVNEFDGRAIGADIDGSVVLKGYGFHNDSLGMNFMALVLMALLYRLLAILWQVKMLREGVQV